MKRIALFALISLANSAFSQNVTELSAITTSEEFGKNEHLIIFPNPTSGTVALIFPEEKQVLWKVNVYNAVGILLAHYEENVGRVILDLSALEAGSYIIEANDGTRSYTNKLIRN